MRSKAFQKQISYGCFTNNDADAIDEAKLSLKFGDFCVAASSSSILVQHRAIGGTFVFLSSGNDHDEVTQKSLNFTNFPLLIPSLHEDADTLCVTHVRWLSVAHVCTSSEYSKTATLLLVDPVTEAEVD